MRIRKSVIFTFVLLFLLLIVGSVVAYDILHPNKDKFELATLETDVPVRKVLVPPFLFEENSSAQTDAVLDEFSEEITGNLLRRIIENSHRKNVKEPETTEFAPTDEQHSDVENKLKSSAVKFSSGHGPVMIAVVIDDMGVSVPHTRDILSLEKPVTASFLTYGAADKKQVQEAKEKGFEVMLHAPMMPHGRAELAPVTLSPDMDEVEIKNKFIAMLDRYNGMGLKGVNNHMGSLFTEDEKSMGYVMQILKERGMFFLDSKTTSKSVGEKVAAKYGVPYIARDVFLDNENDFNYITEQLHRAERIAHMRGYAVAIGHPKTQTYRALRAWMKNLDKRNIRLVKLRDLVREVNKKS